MSAVEKVVKSVDSNAKLAVDLGTKTVSIDSALAPAALKAAIDDAGYGATSKKACCSHVA
ncbi:MULTISPECIES: cation transporter [Sinorhizobium/Ensifer group]|uniref:Cation transporter n=1 Tax=Ensifer adhaerens TaxID=106592 RepID=A0A9Q8YHK4_ENSAD|nr:MULTISPECIES: cation transporter [Sinorhizobium/Ensifer group]USJ28636.1 cation transporter [Ensifer adhaerens]